MATRLEKKAEARRKWTIAQHEKADAQNKTYCHACNQIVPHGGHSCPRKARIRPPTAALAIGPPVMAIVHANLVEQAPVLAEEDLRTTLLSKPLALLQLASGEPLAGADWFGISFQIHLYIYLLVPNLWIVFQSYFVVGCIEQN